MRLGLWDAIVCVDLTMKRVVALACLTALTACGGNSNEDYPWALPEGVPPPPVPDDNPMTPAKVALGRWLFYDTQLSINGTQSCASCHEQARAFSDGVQQAVGATGEVHPRNSMALVNVGYYTTLTWSHPALTALERQHLIPLFGDEPLEMGLDPADESLLEQLRADQHYARLFDAAFPEDKQPVSYNHLVKALASFTRQLLSFDSAFDRYAYGRDDGALDAAELRGMQLFFSERLECHHCHGGFNFSESSTHDNAAVAADVFHNTGLYNLDASGAYPAASPGLSEHTQRPADNGKFRAPTLRNIAVSAPYMHDGSLASLEEVVDFYARGGRLTSEGPNRGDGAENPNKSVFVAGFEISISEKQDLIAFLQSLTDETFLRDPALANPHRPRESARTLRETAATCGTGLSPPEVLQCR